MELCKYLSKMKNLIVKINFFLQNHAQLQNKIKEK